MALFDQWPYVNIHNLNTDWLVKTVKAVKDLAEAIKEKTDNIDDSVARAQDSAANAKTSEDNAKLSEDASANYYRLTSALVGKPLTADTLADMTDTTTVYIYTGSEPGMNRGDWYYYDGNDWVSGGVYGGDGGINENARNLLKYILDRTVFKEAGMDVYVNALYEALAHSGTIVNTFTITNALVHVVNSNTATGCEENDSYIAILTAENNYTITSVLITMGGVDITSAVYDTDTGSINIPAVTGDIVITASATTNAGYIEVGSPSITSDILTCSAGNFIKTTEAFSPGSYSWTIRCKYQKTSTSSTYSDIFGSVDSNNASYQSVLFELNNAQGTSGSQFLSSTGSSWDITGSVSSTVPNPLNRWIYVEISFDGSQYDLKTSLDGTTWNTAHTVSSSTAIVGGYHVGFGLRRNGTLAGQIDLTECKIWINGQLWWKAVA